jgi:glyoxylase-like metal-dependent hydrolase (beta-lactamase superfamily II)
MRMSTLATLALLAACFAGPVAADEFGASEPTPGAQPFQLGSLTLIALRDSQFVARNDAKIFGADAGVAAVAEVLKAEGLAEDRISVNIGALLVKTGARIVLIDTGNGPKGHGVLQASLRIAGITPAQVTDVLITHSHGDHVGGLVDVDGKAAFPNAMIRMSAAEWAWVRSKPESNDLVKAIKAHVRTFTPGGVVAPGIRSVSLNGHTPGHVGYEIFSGREKLLDIGDLAHSSVISLQKPEWAMGFDSDRALTKVTRRATLAKLAEEREWTFAPHFPFPGVGHVVVDNGAFRWVDGTP